MAGTLDRNFNYILSYFTNINHVMSQDFLVSTRVVFSDYKNKFKIISTNEKIIGIGFRL